MFYTFVYTENLISYYGEIEHLDEMATVLKVHCSLSESLLYQSDNFTLINTHKQSSTHYLANIPVHIL